MEMGDDPPEERASEKVSTGNNSLLATAQMWVKELGMEGRCRLDV